MSRYRKAYKNFLYAEWRVQTAQIDTRILCHLPNKTTVLCI
jgi:hypothetical protein